MRKLYLIYALVAVIPLALFILVQVPLVWQWHAVTQSQQVKNRIREEVLRLQWLTADIENGFRGYVLTNQATFLHPVVTGEARMQDSVDHLLKLTEDLPNLQARVKVLAMRLHELIESKRKLTLQIDGGKQDEVLAYIRAGEGLVLSKTIEKAVDDFEARLTEEFSRVDTEEKSLKEQTIRRLVIADVAMLILGIAITWVMFRSASGEPGLRLHGTAPGDHRSNSPG
ncbi:MAG TPA: CHASE3 domain-containing protein [Nitrospiraceae bacterium]|nr:CHASE3 domain-containing protein [Nitrospiraceae bacterium]